MKCLETICMKCQICFVLFFVWGVGDGGGGWGTKTISKCLLKILPIVIKSMH